MKANVLFFLLLVSSAFADTHTLIENSNFTLSQDDEIYNYDRFRIRSDYSSSDYFSTIIVDYVNFMGTTFTLPQGDQAISYNNANTPLNTRTKLYSYSKGVHYGKLHRLYTGYEDEKNRIVFGLQNITMGVGRIWTPSNLFNPKNSLALEPDEIFPVLALNYTKHLNDTSKLMIVSSQKSDKSFNYAAQVKSFYDGFDAGLNLVFSDTTTMIATELEGHLGDTGIEVRTEIAYIQSRYINSSFILQETDFTQAIIGADYGFVDGLTLTIEVLLNSRSFDLNSTILNTNSEIAQNMYTTHFQTALSATYAFNIALSGSIVYIESFQDNNSRFIAPSLNYTINDFNTLNFGALLQFGDASSTYVSKQNTFFIKYNLGF